MPRSLTGRFVVAFAVVGLAVLLAVGGTVFAVLRGLHAEATLARLDSLADSLLPQARQLLASGDLRGAIGEISDNLKPQGVAVLTVGVDGAARTLDGVLTGAMLVGPGGGTARGDTLKGVTSLSDGRSWVYAATVVRPNALVGLRAIAFATPERSGALALADVGRAIPAVGLVVFAIGGGAAWLVSRSVAAPLKRLARATADLQGANGAGQPLPVGGPTEIRDLTRRFNAMTAELDSTRRREAEMLANLRHDLRTPVTVIAGFATALADGTASGEAADRAAMAISEEAERLERLVGELGAIERLRSGTDGLRPEPLRADDLLAEALARFRPRAEGAGITLGTPGPTDGPAIELAADRLAVERILANLVENGFAAVSTPGGHVWLEARQVDSLDGAQRPSVAFSVTDDGPGFPPGATDRVFERFFRADPARAGGGSGLGLAIVRELARAHGGWAVAENLSPRGARVSVVLPVVPVVAAVDAPRQPGR
jgi:signal transduction histidine kinase